MHSKLEFHFKTKNLLVPYFWYHLKNLGLYQTPKKIILINSPPNVHALQFHRETSSLTKWLSLLYTSKLLVETTKKCKWGSINA